MKNHKFLSYKLYLSVFYYVLGILNHRRLVAVNFFEQSLKFDCPVPLQYLCNKEIGIVYYYNGFYDKSNFYLGKSFSLIEADQGDTELYTFLGLVCYVQGDFLKAKEYFEKALRKYKKFEWIKKEFISSHINGCKYYLANPKNREALE